MTGLTNFKAELGLRKRRLLGKTSKVLERHALLRVVIIALSPAYLSLSVLENFTVTHINNDSSEPALIFLISTHLAALKQLDQRSYDHRSSCLRLAFTRMSHPSTFTRTQAPSPGPSGSRTITSTPTPDEQGSSGPGPNGYKVLKLRGGPVTRRRVVWDEDVVDNEHMGRKSSKSEFQTSLNPVEWMVIH
jgi:hypothetical protein